MVDPDDGDAQQCVCPVHYNMDELIRAAGRLTNCKHVTDNWDAEVELQFSRNKGPEKLKQMVTEKIEGPNGKEREVSYTKTVWMTNNQLQKEIENTRDIYEDHVRRYKLELKCFPQIAQKALDEGSLFMDIDFSENVQASADVRSQQAYMKALSFTLHCGVAKYKLDAKKDAEKFYQVIGGDYKTHDSELGVKAIALGREKVETDNKNHKVKALLVMSDNCKAQYGIFYLKTSLYYEKFYFFVVRFGRNVIITFAN